MRDPDYPPESDGLQPPHDGTEPNPQIGRPNLNQCEIGCTAPDITNQNLLPGVDPVLPVF